MTKDKLEELVNKLRDLSDRNSALYTLGLDLVNYEDSFHEVIDMLLNNILNESQREWFDWYCFENEYGRAGMEAWDYKGGNLICQDIDGLYKLIKELEIG